MSHSSLRNHPDAQQFGAPRRPFCPCEAAPEGISPRLSLAAPKHTQRPQQHSPRPHDRVPREFSRERVRACGAPRHPRPGSHSRLRIRRRRGRLLPLAHDAGRVQKVEDALGGHLRHVGRRQLARPLSARRALLASVLPRALRELLHHHRPQAVARGDAVAREHAPRSLPEVEPHITLDHDASAARGVAACQRRGDGSADRSRVAAGQQQ